MSLTKSHIIESIYNNCGWSKQRSADHLESVLALIKKSLESGEDVLISGFGKFCVKEKGQRRGRNPQTDAQITLKERRVVTFRCSGLLRERINGKG